MAGGDMDVNPGGPFAATHHSGRPFRAAHTTFLRRYLGRCPKLSSGRTFSAAGDAVACQSDLLRPAPSHASACDETIPRLQARDWRKEDEDQQREDRTADARWRWIELLIMGGIVTAVSVVA